MPFYDGTFYAIDKSNWVLLMDLVLDKALYFKHQLHRVGFGGFNDTEEQFAFKYGVVLGPAEGESLGTIQYTADGFYGRTSLGWILLGAATSGDMTKAEYDPNNDGIVTYAQSLSNGVDSISTSQLVTHISNTITLEGPGNPNGIVTGHVGQVYRDINSGIFYHNEGGTSWAVT